jgi:hypothetical protein
LLVVYVDDFVVAGIEDWNLTEVTRMILKSFELRDPGIPKKKIGWNVIVKDEYVMLTQQNFVEKS